MEVWIHCLVSPSSHCALEIMFEIAVLRPYNELQRLHSINWPNHLRRCVVSVCQLTSVCLAWLAGRYDQPTGTQVLHWLVAAVYCGGEWGGAKCNTATAGGSSKSVETADDTSMSRSSSHYTGSEFLLTIRYGKYNGYNDQFHRQNAMKWSLLLKQFYAASVRQAQLFSTVRWVNKKGKQTSVIPSLPNPMSLVRCWACVSVWKSKLDFYGLSINSNKSKKLEHYAVPTNT